MDPRTFLACHPSLLAPAVRGPDPRGGLRLSFIQSAVHRELMGSDPGLNPPASSDFVPVPTHAPTELLRRLRVPLYAVSLLGMASVALECCSRRPVPWPSPYSGLSAD